MGAIGGGVRWTRRVVLGAVCALVIGVYSLSAYSGVLEWLASNAENTYYNLLVRGFRDGQLNLKREAPPALAQPGGPAALAWTDSVSAGLADLSYYKGKLYLYFGVTPALVLFWPYVALTGHYLTHKDAVVLCFSIGFLAGAGLLRAVWRRYFKETGVGVVAAGTLALGLANLAPALLGRCEVYEVAISCGYALTMLALAGVWGALHDAPRRRLWLAAASLAYGLALGARPSLLFGAVILLVPVAQAWREKRPVWPLLPAAAGPILLLGLGLLVYNALRFDNPLEFGQRYQLPTTIHQQFSPRYFWFNFRVGFLAPAQWSWRPPFMHDIALPAVPKGYGKVDYPFGVLTNIPLVWLALAAPLAWRRRQGEECSLLRGFLGAVALLFGTGALTLCLHDSMCLRYEVEYASPLLLLAVIGVLALESALAGFPAWRRAARCVWGLLLFFSVAFNHLASFELQAVNHTNIGNVLTQAGRAGEAVPQYQMALLLKQDDAAAHHNFGNALLQLGRPDDARDQFQMALEIEPDWAVTHNNLGCVLLHQGRVDEAISHLQKALQIQPDYPEACYNLGDALLQSGRLDDAISQYQKALRINPDYAAAHNNLGNALLQKGGVDEAVSHFQWALQIKPDYADAFYNLGVALFRKGDLDGAIAHYRKALEIRPGDMTALNTLGDALLLRGELDEALAQYHKALEIKPDDDAALYRMGRVLLRKGDLDAAMASFQKSAPTSPDPLRKWSNLGATLLQNGDLEEAIVCFQQALKINPRSADDSANLGLAFSKKGQFKEAVDAWQLALESKPDQLYVLNNLAWLLATTRDASLRDGAKAAALARQAEQLSGDANPMILHTLAAACAETGNYALAAATARRALDLALGQKNDALAAILQKEIKLYQAGTPLRDATP
ncbi:MAG: tetratricopeptide repeat protein [Verrucomicrobiota bacterium]